jgi:hypothetical protein
MSSSPLGCPRVAAPLACYPLSPSRGDRLLPFKQTVIQLSILPSRSTYTAKYPARGTSLAHILLTTGRHPRGTGRHKPTQDATVDTRSVPGRSNLRIRCPKGRGSSTLPSRTTSDLRIFCSSLYRRSASEAFPHACSRELCELTPRHCSSWFFKHRLGLPMLR